jgi:hypothetical protein
MFAVTWEYTALDQLADIYVAAGSDERPRMASAVESLNARLRTDPLAVGESRSGTGRIAVVPPLSIIFGVSESRRTVRVARVRRYGK